MKLGFLSPLRPLVGVCFGISILFTSVFGNYIITVFLFLVFMGEHRLWRRLMDRAISFWMMIPLGFIEFVFGVRIRVTGDLIDIDRPALIIMNHRTRLDWMYMWSALFQQNPWLITTNKISLKAQLRKLPGAGFGMAGAQFVFLERNMEIDKQAFDQAIEYYKGMGMNYQLLLFPEGTDKSPWTTAKSTEYAKRNGLRQLRHVLYPRTTGFYHLLKKMRQLDYVDYIYDITIAYPYNIVQSEVELVLKGLGPREVHFNVRKIPISHVPESEEETGKWLLDKWIEKEDLLEEFYANPKPYNREFTVRQGEGVWCNWRESSLHRYSKLFSFLFWLFVVSVCTYHIFFLPSLQIGIFYFVLASGYVSYVHGGIDRFVYGSWRRSIVSGDMSI